MGTVRVQELSEDEWQFYRAIRLEALSVCPQYFYYSKDSVKAQEEYYWRQQLRQFDRKLFGLFDGKTIIGTAGVFEKHPVLNKGGLVCGGSYIREEYRGREYSDLLNGARLEWARWQGGEEVYVGHRAGNENAERTILRNGFSFCEKAIVRWCDGEMDVHFVYSLKL